MSDGLHSGIDTPDATVSEFLLHRLVIVVAVKDDLPVFVEGLAGNIVGIGAGINGIGEFGEFLSDNGVEYGVDHGDILRGSNGAEFETGPSVGEGRGAVAIFSGYFEGEDFVSSEVQGLDARDVLSFALSVFEVREVEGDIIAKVGGHDGGRGLAGAEAEVIAGTGDGHPHQVSVLVDGGDDGGHDDGEGGVVPGGGIDGLRVQHHDAVLGGDAPVVVLPAPVDVVEGLLLQQSGHAVASGDLLDDLHDHQVLVDLGGIVAVERGELVLVGSNLSVASLKGNSKAPALVLDLLHAGQGGVGQTGRGHVVVTHLLAAVNVIREARIYYELANNISTEDKQRNH